MPSIKSDSVYLLLSERGISSSLVPVINSFSMDSSDGFTSGYMVVTDSSKLTKATLFTWSASTATSRFNVVSPSLICEV